LLAVIYSDLPYYALHHIDESPEELEAFEMWIWKKMLNISWTITNQQVLDSIWDERTLLDSMHQRKHKRLGHILRHDGRLRTILEGRIEGVGHALTECRYEITYLTSYTG